MQGFHGPFSHNANSGTDCSYALDFGLPLGTEVIAVARGRVHGVIRNAKGVYRGTDRKEATEALGQELATTNQVVLFHSELGAFTRYSHLNGQSICVQKGDIIEPGQVLAQTGLSGWVGPVSHLHFQVERPLRKSVPITIKGYSGPYEHTELMAALRATGLRWEEFFADLLTT